MRKISCVRTCTCTVYVCAVLSPIDGVTYICTCTTMDEGWEPPFFATSTWILIITACALLLIYDYWCHQYLARLQIPAPKAKPFIGNTFDFIFCKDGIPGFHEKNFARHGKIFGFYTGWRAVLLAADVDFVRMLCIKEFSNFTNRKKQAIDNKPFDKALTALRDDHWKDVRGILSPTFSGSKMKLMAPLINSCLDPMIRKVAKHYEEGKSVQLKDIYGGYLIDAIGNSAFGLTLNSQETENDPFLIHAKDIFTPKLNLAVIVFLVAPFLAPILNYFNVSSFNRKTMDFFENIMEQAVELRKSGTERRVDFLQLMLDAHKKSELTAEDKAQATEEEKLEEEHRKGMSKKSLTMDELKAQGLTFFLAGFETSSTTLGFTSYLLATNPEVQDRLINEIDTIAPGRDHVTYENIAKMTYLDMVICETLRKYPPAIISAREAGREYKYQGFTIPEGMEVFFSIWQIHHDPELWEDPDKFDPERFTPERREKRHPCAYIPFGAGPRNCVGMRFAQLQIKMGLVRMLQNFRLETCPETEIPPVVGKFGFLTPPNGFKLSAVPRS
ncbi:cytochrome P450 3A24-like [Acanthaster planci]|uniref:Thromboxane-A synthase n=1 Tax=Acanthaster planci TaxID=133434 RepID=A0A8B7XK19_ACAPL|nr:cytochrome P450 3A24-like [Acanthaster planci]